jgi:hypothetical protein
LRTAIEAISATGVGGGLAVIDEHPFALRQVSSDLVAADDGGTRTGAAD